MSKDNKKPKCLHEMFYVFTMAGTDLETPAAKACDSRGVAWSMISVCPLSLINLKYHEGGGWWVSLWRNGARGGTLRAKPSRPTREKSSSTRGAQDEKFAAG